MRRFRRWRRRIAPPRCCRSPTMITIDLPPRRARSRRADRRLQRTCRSASARALAGDFPGAAGRRSRSATASRRAALDRGRARRDRRRRPLPLARAAAPQRLLARRAHRRAAGSAAPPTATRRQPIAVDSGTGRADQRPLGDRGRASRTATRSSVDGQGPRHASPRPAPSAGRRPDRRRRATHADGSRRPASPSAGRLRRPAPIRVRVEGALEPRRHRQLATRPARSPSTGRRSPPGTAPACTATARLRRHADAVDDRRRPQDAALRHQAARSRYAAARSTCR